ncbi:hypothetical protein [Spiroplasma endosymbiont of Ammophila pubescens]|uniref:hypothetical protein n=1 Tax=Spiroplasma endosymbiont of Ammophila pubescens TaxID=3066315 RepID=UPI0032B1451D
MIKVQGKKHLKFFASKKWYVTALVLILLATLQEIIMESTDLVDNFFASSIQKMSMVIKNYLMRLNIFLEQIMFIM